MQISTALILVASLLSRRLKVRYHDPIEVLVLITIIERVGTCFPVPIYEAHGPFFLSILTASVSHSFQAIFYTDLTTMVRNLPYIALLCIGLVAFLLLATVFLRTFPCV